MGGFNRTFHYPVMIAEVKLGCKGGGLDFAVGRRLRELFAAGFGGFAAGVPIDPQLLILLTPFGAELVISFFRFSFEPFLYAVGQYHKSLSYFR